MREVGPVGDAEILKRAEEIAFQGFPYPDFGGDSSVKAIQDRLAVRALRSRCEAEEFLRTDIVEKLPVGIRRRVVELSRVADA